MEEKVYSINSARAISETLEGETIIINLDTGNYYSVNESATAIWKELASPCTLSRLIQALSAQYDGSTDTLKKSIGNSVAFFLKEQLIVEMPASSAQTAGTSVTAQIQTDPSTKKPFTPAKIDKYDDMQEMLLADPIHDVDTTGWPQLKK